MKNSAFRQENLAELKLNFNSPILMQSFVKTFQEEVVFLEGENSKWGLTNFLNKYVEDILNSIQIEKLSEITNNLGKQLDVIRDENYIKFDISDNGDFQEANGFIRDIYSKWNDIQLRKEIYNDHILLLKKSITYLKSFKTTMSLFIQEGEYIHGVKFNKTLELKNFINFSTNSIDSYIDVLKNQLGEISSWIDNIISSKVNMLQKAESSLRLLAKYATWDGACKGGKESEEEDISF
jgi:hypothetical protein